MPAKTFPAGYWDPDMHAYLYLLEFAASDWKSRIGVRAPQDALTNGDLNEVLRLQQDDHERKDHKDDILDQASTFSQVYLRRYMFTATSHPRTFDVVRVSVLIGRALVMHFKNEFLRPRPSQLSPKVIPMFDVPGHPSYPSGHSTQAHLIAHALSVVHPDGSDPGWSGTIFALAADIARNRERAGVHYPTDSAAGVSLAAQIFDIMRTKCGRFGALLDEASREW